MSCDTTTKQRQQKRQGKEKADKFKHEALVSADHSWALKQGSHVFQASLGHMGRPSPKEGSQFTSSELRCGLPRCLLFPTVEAALSAA